MELILIRHGITPGNLQHRFVGRIDQPLAPEGEALARAVAPTLPAIERLYLSPMLRCRQTAALLWPDVAQTVIDDLRETDFGIYEGLCHDELQGDPVYRRWLAGELTVGEPIEDCSRRASHALELIAADVTLHGYRRAGVVAHGGIFMSMLARHGRPEREYYRWMMGNCGGYRAELSLAPPTLHVSATIGDKEHCNSPHLWEEKQRPDD